MPVEKTERALGVAVERACQDAVVVAADVSHQRLVGAGRPAIAVEAVVELAAEVEKHG
jgi:hypothetical protein